MKGKEKINSLKERVDRVKEGERIMVWERNKEEQMVREREKVRQLESNIERGKIERKNERQLDSRI